ncbi:MAG: GrpB family protein [Candidatus Diapherotrites archaeon]
MNWKYEGGKSVKVGETFEDFQIHPFSAQYKKYFSAEKRYLRAFFKREKIFHIGSTAVKGLPGKGVIDILVLVGKKGVERAWKKLNEKTSYVPHGGLREGKRFFFARKRMFGKKPVRFHLHLMWKESAEWKKRVRFVEYLNKHPKEAKKYEKFKRQAAQKSKLRRRKYTKLKENFVQEMTEKAWKLSE